MEIEQTGKHKKALRESFILNYVRNRIVRKKNALIAIVGGTGSGKSYSALSIGEQLDPNFDITRVAFTPVEFLDLIRDEAKLPHGSVIVLDEGQLSVSSREWFSIQNKLLNQVLSTFRYKQLVVIFTTPDLSFIDSQARKLFHMYMETVSINRKKGIATLKPFQISVMRRKGQVWYIYPTTTTDKGTFKFKRVRIKKPSQKICFRYEKKKREFAENMYNEFRATLAGDKGMLEDGKKILNPIERKYYLFKKASPDIKDEEIAVLLERKPATVKQIRKRVREKGWMDKKGNLIEKDATDV